MEVKALRPYRVYFFGVAKKGGAGHYLYHADGRMVDRYEEVSIPFRISIVDAGLLPQGTQQLEGIVHRSVINGWTVLTFWDRSGDSRLGSNSSFILEGEHSTEKGLAVARGMLPVFVSRLTFQLIPA